MACGRVSSVKHSLAEAENGALPQVDSAATDLPVGARTTPARLKQNKWGLRSSGPAAIFASPIAARSH